MNFYVYEDMTRKLVRIHKGSCRHCNEGQGTRLTYSPYKKWYGPYATLVEAQEFAQSLKRKSTRNCITCLDW
jgi:hypothetical protein